MTDDQPSTPPPRPELTERGRQVLEVSAWAISPVLLLISTAIIAFVLGAPWLRTSLVFAVLAIAAGGYLLFRPQHWLPFGKVRTAALVYCGVGALVIALAVSSPQPVRTAGTQTENLRATTPQQAPAPQRRSLYPWAYTVSSFTITCENSTAVGAGEIIATTEDGRTFAVWPAAGFTDTEFRCLVGSEEVHGTANVHTGVQA